MNSEIKPGGEIILTVSGMSNDGRAISRTKEGLAVFVEDALPGQTVRARILSIHKRHADAVCTEILEHSQKEREPECPHAGKCGGCPWAALPYAEQLKCKRQIVLDCFRRLGHLDLSDADVPLPVSQFDESDSPKYYRNKIEFSFKTDSHTRIGFKRRRSSELMEVGSCLLLRPETEIILKHVRTFLNGRSVPFLRYLVLRSPLNAYSDAEAKPVPQNTCSNAQSPAPDSERRPALRLFTAEIIIGPCSESGVAFSEKMAKSLCMHVPALTGALVSMRKDKSDVAYGERIVCKVGQTVLHENMTLRSCSALPCNPSASGKTICKLRDQEGCGDHAPDPNSTCDAPEAFSSIRLKLGAKAFFQVNTHAAELLYGAVFKFAGIAKKECPESFLGTGDAVIWDVYGGIGGIALALAPYAPCGRIFGLESTAESVQLARENAADAFRSGTMGSKAPHYRFYHADADRLESLVKESGRVPGCIVLDPPRAGLSTKVRESLKRLLPSSLILVSCDPATLARDLADLISCYRIRAIRLVDLFPNTPHIETVSLLLREKDHSVLQSTLEYRKKQQHESMGKSYFQK